MNRFLRAALAVLALCSPGMTALRAQDFPRGEVVPRVAARSDTTQHYALYLPSGYSDDRAWPVVFVMDPRGQALVPLERFRPAAERLGYVLLSSYDTRSDVAVSPTGRALEAMLGDAQNRLSVDGRRIYLAGFSGTAREAWTYALRLGGHAAGVIGLGAGLPGDAAVFQLRAAEAPPFAFFGGAGTTDFNHDEVRALGPKLAALRVPHRIVIYEGAHAWPPEPVFAEALEWMTLRAMREGKAPRDEAWTDSLLARRAGEAREMESGGKLLEALERWRAVAEDFEGVRGVDAADARVAELEEMAPVRRALAAQASLARRDSAHARRFAEFVRGYGEGSRPPAEGRVLATLQVAPLQREAADTSDLPRAQSARRVLENLFVYTVFYGPESYLARDDSERALALLRLAGRIKPDSPEVCYAEARVHARLGHSGEALRALGCAIASGRISGAALDADAAFASLRADPAFTALRGRLPASPPKP